MWFECAAGCQLVDGKIVQATPPTAEELTVWFEQYEADKELRDRVYQRYVVTRRNFKNIVNWASKQFFFRNATKQQLEKLYL